MHFLNQSTFKLFTLLASDPCTLTVGYSFNFAFKSFIYNW